MPKRRFDLVVFDWDGTVVDSTAMIALSIQKAAADLGLRIPTLEQASHVIGLGLHDALAGAVPDLDAARIEEFSARYRFHYFAGEPEIVLFTGVRELIVELAEGGAAAGGGDRARAAADSSARSAPPGSACSSRRRAAPTRRSRSRIRPCCSN